MKIASRFVLFLMLTVLTQVGGLVYLSCLFFFPGLSAKIKNRYAKAGAHLCFFLLVYLMVSFTVVPLTAGIFGRVPLPMLKSKNGIRPDCIMTCLLNRHYVRKEMKHTLDRILLNLAKENGDVSICYLDASFPFINGFPLLPHWSHNDGRKLDITYYYSDKKTNTAINGSPSWIGYGFCEEPTAFEACTSCDCAKRGYWQYDLLRHLVPASLHERYQVNTARTIQLIRYIAADPDISMIFIEPHLKQRWKLMDVRKIRFHGCHAVRHDDHIHIQIR